MRQKNIAEELLAFHLRAAKIWMKREHRFHPTRRWRFDFADPGSLIAVEIEGLNYEGAGKKTKLGGRHVSVKGFKEDCEKYNEAAVLGWRVLRVTVEMVKSGKALQYIERMYE